MAQDAGTGGRIMASAIILTPLFDSNPQMQTTYLYANKAAAYAGTGGVRGRYIYKSWSVLSPSSLHVIPYSGYANIDAKFMGGSTNKFLIQGYVIDRGQTGVESELAINLIELLSMNKVANQWKITYAGEDLTSARGAIIQNITSGDLGDGSGARWAFAMELQDLGAVYNL